MKRFIRIGVVTAWPDDDWHSARLLEACARRAEAVALDPAALAARVDGRGVTVLAGGIPASGFDAFLLARGLGRAGTRTSSSRSTARSRGPVHSW